jgi:carbonic anhydrase
MNVIDKLLLENKAWASEKTSDDPGFFRRLSEIQTPDFLWIGCSDSRVPANEITGTQPGEIFVHRNVANMVVHTDLNLLTVLEYAIKHLKIKHVIVCGHYGCGGVEAAISKQDLGVINKWLMNIKEVYRIHKVELEEIKDKKKLLRRLVELNVMEQVMNLAKTSIIQNCWKEEQRPILHGWVYGLDDGLIKTLFAMDDKSKMEDVFEYGV